MGMTPLQAKQLGGLVAQARAAKGLSVRALARELGVGVGWVGELEAGVYADPSPAALTRLAELLDLDPKRIDRFLKGTLAGSLPNSHIYFRAKYGVSPEDAEKIRRYAERFMTKDHDQEAA